jgi:hypothetical protein
VRTGITALFFVFLKASAALAGAAHVSCAPPNPSALLGEQASGFEMFATAAETGGEHLRWVSISKWDDVFLIDCDAAKRAEIGLGPIEKQFKGPLVSGKPTLIVVYHSGFGSDINLQSVTLLQYRDAKIARLWDHSSFEGAYPPKSLGPQEETVYHWRFTNEARRIEVTGRYFTYRYPKTNRPLRQSDVRSTRSLKPQHFCLNDRAMKYLPCR